MGQILPRQKVHPKSGFEEAPPSNPKINTISDTSTVEADPGHLSETSLKLIKEWIGKLRIEEAALRQYKAQISRLVSKKAPFKESVINTFHQQVSQEILSSFDSTFENILTFNPSLTQELQHERDKLKLAIKTQSRTFLVSYKNSIETITRSLKDRTLEAENAYVENMERSLESKQTIDETKSLHAKWMTNAMQIFSDTLREKTSLEIEPWMTQELKSKLEDRFAEIQDEFRNSKPALTVLVSNAKEKSEKLNEDNITDNPLTELQIGTLVEEKLSNILPEKLEKLVEDKLSNMMQEKLYNQLKDEVANIVQEKLDTQVESKVSNIVQNKLGKQLEDEVANAVQNKLDKQVDSKVSNILQNKLDNQLEDMVSNIARKRIDKHLKDKDKATENYVEKYVPDKIKQFLESNHFGKLFEDKLANIEQKKLDKLEENKVTKTSADNLVPHEIEQLLNSNQFVNLIDAKLSNILQQNLDNWLLEDIIAKNYVEKHFPAKLQQFLESNEFDKLIEDKHSTILTKKLVKLVEDSVNEKTAKISDQQLKLHKDIEMSKNQLNATDKEHLIFKANKQDCVNVVTSRDNNDKISAANSTTKEPLNYISKPQVSKSSTTSPVSKPLIGGQAKSTSPANNIVDGTAKAKHMKPVVNSGVTKFQQEGQVTTAKVTVSDRQTPASRGHTTITLVLEEKSNPSTGHSVAERKSFFEGAQLPGTQLPQTDKQHAADLKRSVSANSIAIPK